MVARVLGAVNRGLDSRHTAPYRATMTRAVSRTVQSYLDHLSIERRLADLSVESYRRDLDKLGRFAAGCGRRIESLDRHELDRFVRELAGQGLSPRSVGRAVAAVRGFYRFVALEGRHARNAADDLQAPRACRRSPSVCPPRRSIASSSSPIPAPSGDCATGR